MHRLIVILLTLASGGLLASLPSTVDGLDESALADRVKAHINERMHETCRSVVLKRVTDTVFRGQAEFLNGIAVDLEVSVSNGATGYRFLERPRSDTPLIQARLEELESLVVQLEAELARLTELCLHAGIDVNPPQPEVVSDRPEEANNIAAGPVAESPLAVYEDQEALAEERPRFTWQLYETIGKGMSYAEISDVLGEEGHLISSSYFDDAENKVFVWTNPDDSHICVVLRNGTILVKTQFGLPETATTPLH